MTPRLTLLTGGVRSGKSARALVLAHERSAGECVLFVATAQPFDDEMRTRIDVHRNERPLHWSTLEEPLDLAAALSAKLASRDPRPALIVVDCLTLWTSNILLTLPDDGDAEAIVAERTRALLMTLGARAGTTPAIIVTNEVGLGIVPATSLGRRYRDALGRANQLVAAAADEVILLVSGIDVPIKPRG
ncbi:MAG TPA: bifunctional adenosylcobinamide kinase/adenosylcobinamide-phosphate guanylyltransferase [Gemmatimonadaceae bacterium]|jgi:adenosylcobinamide kinase/adenosylcobinamide-phosphate guanylyltransferase